jgi:predicted NBD/HSP70 family sugar kinase
VELRDAVSARLSLPVFVESAPIACGIAKLWLPPNDLGSVGSFAYASISDGVGVGLVIYGEPVRGAAQTAGEFGHVSLDPNGPMCVCGRRGCWEAFAGNAATVARYAKRVAGERTATETERARARRAPAPDVEEIVQRARRGERAAVDALIDTGREIGRGLSAVVNTFNPARIYLGGEVTAAWNLLEPTLRAALAEGTLTVVARTTPVIPDRSPAEYRLLGAVALVTAPTFAAAEVG